MEIERKFEISGFPEDLPLLEEAMRCAALLSVQLGGAQIVNLELETPDPADYDLIVVGSAVRMNIL